MNRRETYAVERIDRSREHAAATEARTARTRALEDRAVAYVRLGLAMLPDVDRPAFVKMLASVIRRHLVEHHGETAAASILSSEAGKANGGAR
jgi:hypothetical protein